ncbi:centromere protein U-like [Montipora capricornis]|uniref:centromere protein U-like n=1 Tax=Montipora capricornis TaxID=246305 RepID=UPI0035F15F0D
MADLGSSSGFFRQAALARLRPSKRQTTARSFKITKGWASEGSTQAFAASLSQAALANLPPTQESALPPPLDQEPPLIDDLPGETSLTSTATSPELKATSPLPSDTLHQPLVHQGRQTSSRIHGEGSSENDQLVLLEESPGSIILETSERSLHGDASRDNVARTPSPLSKKFVSETPLSGPGAFPKTSKKIKQGKKRKMDHDDDENEDSLENNYRADRFVRLFNVDRGRKTSVTEITDLDVILTAIEEETLKLSDETQSTEARYAIKEFFIQMRKSFSDMIDITKENKLLKSDLRKSKARMNKLRRALLDVQRKRSRISAKLEKEIKERQQNMERDKVLEDFSSFLFKLEDLQEECRKHVSSKKLSKLDYGGYTNLPSLLIEGHGLLTAASHLRYVNETLHKK